MEETKDTSMCIYTVSNYHYIIQEIQEPLEEEVQEIKEQPHDTKV